MIQVRILQLLKQLTICGLGRRFPVFRCDEREANLAFLVDVRVVDVSIEVQLRRLERVLGTEFNLHFKGTLVVWWTILLRK